jgi:hypothetical protein
LTSAGWIVATPRVEQVVRSARRSKAAPPAVQIREVVVPRGAGRLGRGRGEAQHREQAAHGERHDQRGGEAAALAPPDAAQPQLHRAGQEAHVPQRAVERALSADNRAGGLQRLAQVGAHAAGGSPAARRAAFRQARRAR